MGIRFQCSECGHKLHVKTFLAGKRAVCPQCQAKIEIPQESTEAEPSDLGEREGKAAPPRAAQPAATATASAAISSPAAKVAANAGKPATAGGKPVAAGSWSTSVPPITAGPAGQKVAPQSATAPAAAARVTGAAKAGGNAQAKPKPNAVPPRTTPSPAAETADPLCDSQAAWYVRAASGGRFGPANGPLLRTWIDEGRIGRETLVWREGWKDWQPAADVFPRFATTAVAPPPPDLPQGFTPGPAHSHAGANAAPDNLDIDLDTESDAGGAVRYRGRSKRGSIIALIVLTIAVLALLPGLVFVLMRQ